MDRKNLLAIIYGWITILFLTLLFSAILVLIIRYTSITLFTFSTITLISGLLILFLGGLISGLKGKSNGWMLGLITGIGFIIIVIGIQYLGFNEPFTLKQSVYQLTYLLCAILGGIVGVNISKSNEAYT